MAHRHFFYPAACTHAQNAHSDPTPLKSQKRGQNMFDYVGFFFFWL